MAIEDTKIKCHGCSFVGAIAHSPITLRYHLPDGTVVDAHRESGWCRKCRNIENIEPRFDRAKLKAEILELSQKPGIFSKLFGGVDQSSLEEKREKRSRLLRLAELRRSPPRCLVCGSTDVIPLQFDAQGNIVGFLHDCGRALYRAPSDPGALRFIYKAEFIDLDVEGRTLSSPNDEQKVVKKPIPRGRGAGIVAASNVKRPAHMAPHESDTDTISDFTIIFGPPVEGLLDEIVEHARALGKSVPETWVWYIHKLIRQICERDKGVMSDLDALFTTVLGVSVQVSEPFLTYTFHEGTIVPAIIMKPSGFSFPTGVGQINWEDPALPSIFGRAWKVGVGAEWTRVLSARFQKG